MEGNLMNVRFSISMLIVIVAAAVFLGYTQPGRSVLKQMGFAVACDGSCD
jgi:uncharacterized membrane protein